MSMKHQDAIVARLNSGAVAAMVCACAVSTLAQAPAQAAETIAPVVIPLSATGPGSLTGIWGNPGSANGESVVTADGKPIPYRPAAAALLAQRGKNATHSPESPCVPAGMPTMMEPPVAMPLQILETPQHGEVPPQVTVLFGSFGIFRIIRLTPGHMADPDPTYFGDSVGHWEGKTLVVDTIALMDKMKFFGVPLSGQAHLIERFQHVDKDTLQDRVTIEDATTYTRPWTWVITLKRLPAARLTEEERHPC